MNGQLNAEQVAKLLQPIKPSRVLQANGQSHVPAYDVAAHLTRILGYGGWDSEEIDVHVLFEDFEERHGKNKDGSPRTYKVWTVGYSAHMRLIVKDTKGNEVSHYENGACGDAVNQPSRADAHHLAMTTAISTALKRCAAFGLGDQFGLSLYNKGNVNALVGVTLVMPKAGTNAEAEVDLDSHIPKPEALGNDERQSTLETTSEPAGATTGPQSGDSGEKKEPTPESTPVLQSLTPLHEEIKAHAKYKALASESKGLFLSNTVGYQVTSIRQLTDADCEQVLAALRAL